MSFLIRIIKTTILLVLLYSSGSGLSYADDASEFLQTQGIAGNNAALLLSSHANENTDRLGNISQASGRVKSFLRSSQNQLNRARLDVIAEGIEVANALRLAGLREATIQLAGATAGLVVQHGLPTLAGAGCSFFATPVTGRTCHELTYRFIDITGFDNWVEHQVEVNLGPAAINQGGRQVAAGTGTAQLPSGVRSGGNIDIDVNVNDVNTNAGAQSTAKTDIGVARGGDIEVNVNVGGQVTTSAEGRSQAYTGIGIAEGEGIDVAVSIGDDVTTVAGGQSEAVSIAGAAYGDNADVDVRVGNDVTTIASGKSSAYTGLGIAEGDNARANAQIKDSVITAASGRSDATTEVGVADNGRVQVYIKGVNTIASGSGSASNEIGSSSGSDVGVSVGGVVSTTAHSGRDSSTKIGAGKSVSIGGDVVNIDGDLTIGGTCAARRDGKCCIEIHRRLCVIRKVPPDDKGRCPPRYERWGWMCYRYSDKRHSIDK